MTIVEVVKKKLPEHNKNVLAINIKYLPSDKWSNQHSYIYPYIIPKSCTINIKKGIKDYKVNIIDNPKDVGENIKLPQSILFDNKDMF